MPVSGFGNGPGQSGSAVLWRENAAAPSPVQSAAKSQNIENAPTNPGTFLPSAVSGLQAWYDADALTVADGGNIGTFTDRQGAFDATLTSGTGPVLRYSAQNGRKLADFIWANSAQMTISSALMSGATSGSSFIVFRQRADPVATDHTGAPLDAFTSDTGPNLGSHTPYSDGVVYEHWGLLVRRTVGNLTPDFSTSPRIYNPEVTSGGVFTDRVDGVQVDTAAGQTVSFGTKTRNLGWTLGGAGAIYFDGWLAEVLEYNAVLAQADREKVEGYLAWKWGLVANLDAAHPYKSSPPDATAAPVGTSVGTATASGVGKAQANGVGSASSVGTASGVGKALDTATGSAAGAASVSGAGKTGLLGVGAATGAAAASGAGKASAKGVGSSAGAATAAGQGKSGGLGIGVGTAAGSSSAAGAGRATAKSLGSTAGSAAVSGRGKVYCAGVGLASGFGVAVGAGRSIALARGAAAGSSVASGAGVNGGAEQPAGIAPASRTGVVTRLSRTASIAPHARIGKIERRAR